MTDTHSTENNSRQAPLTAVGDNPVQQTVVDVPVIAAARQMNPYFNQFPGCRHSNLEPLPPQDAPDAHIMDLRNAIPPATRQYLDWETLQQTLEWENLHQTYDVDEFSGESDTDGSSAGSSFIDDEPVALTDADIAFVKDHVAPRYPGMAERLCSAAQQLSEQASPAPMRKRCRVVYSSSSE
jgi:hypothetical protein